MKIYLAVCLSLILFSDCNRKMTTEASSFKGNAASEVTVSSGMPSAPLIPVCIQKKIDSIKLQTIWNPPAEIHLYKYEGRDVYLISSNCCDMFNTAVDENCNYLCAPSGGFTGQGDRKCPDFNAQAKHVRLVWRDERAGKK